MATGVEALPPRAYGSMRRIFGESAAVAIVALPSLAFRPADFFVRIWRAKAWRRLTLPVAVILKRLAAPLCVFSFMYFFCFRTCRARGLRTCRARGLRACRARRLRACRARGLRTG